MEWWSMVGSSMASIWKILLSRIITGSSMASIWKILLSRIITEILRQGFCRVPMQAPNGQWYLCLKLPSLRETSGFLCKPPLFCRSSWGHVALHGRPARSNDHWDVGCTERVPTVRSTTRWRTPTKACPRSWLRGQLCVAYQDLFQ